MKKTIDLLLAILGTFGLLVIFLIYIMSSYIAEINNDFQDKFEDAIRVEVERRLHQTNTFFSFSYQHAPVSDNVKIHNKDTITSLQKDSLYKKQTVDQRQRQIFQTYLRREGYPVNMSILDSLFASSIEKNNLLEIGIKYIDNEEKNTEYSNINNKIYSAYHTELTELGVDKEMSVQAYYTLPFSYILWRSRMPVAICLFIWLIITGLLVFFLIYRRKKMKESIVYVPVKDVEKITENDVLLKVTDTIYYNPKRAELHCNQKNIISLSGQIAVLFQAFIEAPDYFLSNEQISTSLGWEKIEDTKTRRGQVINRLKEALKPISEIRVINQNRKGYLLAIEGNKERHKDITE